MVKKQTTVKMQVDNLQNHIGQLLDVIEKNNTKLETAENKIHTLAHANNQLIKYVNTIASDLAIFQDNAKYELFDKYTLETMLPIPKINCGEKVISQLRDQNKSLARFGDGEFSTIAGRIRHKFQTEDDKLLAQRLAEVLHSTEENLLLAIANNYGNLDRYTEQAKREIRSYMTDNVRREHIALLDMERDYWDAYLTRPYLMHIDNVTDAARKRFMALKTIWQERNCIFVEGCKTRMGIGNDLYSNALSIQRIVCPAENAFREYDQILSACKRQQKDKLFLLALGPTATVLAHDLSLSGYQAIDIGHLDLEYEWFLQNKGVRTATPYKYNNEYAGGESVEAIQDSDLEKQILVVIE